VIDADRFLSRLVGPIYDALAARVDLASVLGAVVTRARAAHPDLVLDENAFLDHLADRLPPDAGVAVLDELFLEDLYLAAACTASDPVAVARCEQLNARDIERGFDSLSATPALREETWQRLRERIFVGKRDQPPAIASFTGRGSLRKWLRVAATRLALNVVRSQRRDEPIEAAAELEDAADDLALGHFKRTYQAAFKEAFGAAVAELTPLQRTLLRMHLLDRLSIDQLGELHGVHRTSAARWLREARALLAEGTRRHLHARLGVSDPELDSIMNVVRSRIDLSLTRLFGSG
jgi:RNA polymerase sigma-70 factor, ECF subfamily